MRDIVAPTVRIRSIMQKAPQIGGSLAFADRTSSQLAIVIVADDLTGACDAAAPFAKRGAAAEVVLKGMHRIEPAAVQVVAVHTGTRDCDPETAKLRLRSTLEWAHAQEPDLLFKKIDSVFRGNTAVEIATMPAALPDRLFVLAPSFPLQGRKVLSGRLQVEDIAGDTTLDLSEVLAASGLERGLLESIPVASPERIAESFRVAWQAGKRLALCDAGNDVDLDHIVEGGIRSGLAIDWVGSAGLSRALADVAGKRVAVARGVWRPTPAHAAVVFLIGSRHPVTLAQVEFLDRAMQVVRRKVGTIESSRTDLEADAGAVLLIKIGATAAAEEIRAVLGVGLPKPCSLVLSGGDTAAMVCEALETLAIEVEDELLPGIPVGKLRGGFGHGTTVVTKSGGFGGDDALYRIVNQLLHARRQGNG